MVMQESGRAARVPTGLRDLDAMLGGGVRPGIVADAFGANGTGKTQLLFQLAVNSAVSGGRVLYVDTGGQFRPERVLEMLGGGTRENILARITVLRVTNTHEQVTALARINGDPTLVLVDNATDLFSYEYGAGLPAREKNRRFMEYMAGLSAAAVDGPVPVVVTNMIRSIDGIEYENMAGAVRPFAHVRLHLSREGRAFRCEAAWALGDASFRYGIGGPGLRQLDI